MTLSLENFWKAEFSQHQEVKTATNKKLQEPFVKLIDIASEAVKSGNKIIFAGNGGSAADSQHLATELTVRYTKDRKPIAAIALTTDSSALTAIGNDFGFEYLFSRQIEALAKEGDVFLAFSTSGNSENIINAINSAKKIGVRVVGLSGESGGKMAELCDILLNVPSTTTARIQEMHILLGHMFCGALEMRLGLVDIDSNLEEAA